MYLVAVLDKAHHVVFLGLFQDGFRRLVVEFQRLLAVQLNAGDFLVLKIQRAFGVGDGAAGNQQNLPRGVRHDLLIGEIDDIRRVFHNIGQYGDIIRILGQGAWQDQVKRGRVDQRFVAHQLQVEVCILHGADLPDAPGGGIMVRAGHQVAHIVGFAGVGNALVVGGNKHIVQLRAGLGGLVDPVDHRFAQHIRQRLARHPGTGVTRGDNGDCFHGIIPRIFGLYIK